MQQVARSVGMTCFHPARGRLNRSHVSRRSCLKQAVLQPAVGTHASHLLPRGVPYRPDSTHPGHHEHRSSPAQKRITVRLSPDTKVVQER